MEDSHEHELMKNIISRLISCQYYWATLTPGWCWVPVIAARCLNNTVLLHQHWSHTNIFWNVPRPKIIIIIIQEHESRFLEAWILTSWRERRGYLHWTLQCKKVAAVEVLKNHVGWLLLAASVSGRNAAQGCVAGAGGDWLLCWAVSV